MKSEKEKEKRAEIWIPRKKYHLLGSSGMPEKVQDPKNTWIQDCGDR